MQSVFRRGKARSRHYDKTLALVYLSTAIFGFTAIAHQNNLGAVSSVLAGDSITQYGWVIGLTLLGLGLGFFVSREIGRAHV